MVFRQPFVAAAAIVVVAVVLSFGKSSHEQSISSRNAATYTKYTAYNSSRLPTFAAPVHYDIELQIDLTAFKFDGKLAVTVDVRQETSQMVLNALDLIIPAGSVWFRCNATRQIFQPTMVELDQEDEILVLSFNKSLPLGEATLGMEFQGNLTDSLAGLYRSAYVINNVTRYMAVTQFEPVDARRCFPCWDEPALKATFQLIVHAPTDRVVLSNMPVEVEEVQGSNKRVTFQKSPKMSTYLVALVVGELDYVESATSSGCKVRVYTEVGKSEQGKFALDVATKTLPFYEEYFQTPYALPKLDMVAIPDFAAGAMENFGLITFRTATLLYDEATSATEDKLAVAGTVTHELGHQWFGDLVTMEWWTHLWLNEGFATWLSHLAEEHLHPEWKPWTQFISTMEAAMRIDGLNGSHPIEVEVENAREINEIFDSISYNKGASILRMLQDYLGPKVFQKGLAVYIKKYAYRNARTEDLWSSLSKESGEHVNGLMASWTKQKGYPVVAVTMKDQALRLEQSQYLSSGYNGSSEWTVPVTICFGSYTSVTKHLVKGKVSWVQLPPAVNKNGSSSSTWIKVNCRQTGFYRVQYDEELFASLRAAIASNKLDAIDRSAILDDTYALCSAHKQPVAVLLNLMDIFCTEIDDTVLQNLISISYQILNVVRDAVPKATADTKRFGGKLLHKATEKLGWEPKEGESTLDNTLRGQILEALVSFDYEDIIGEAIRRFHAFLQDRHTPLLSAETRNAAYTAIMRNSTSSNRWGYESLLRIYRETDVSDEKTRVLGRLAYSPDPVLVKEALNFSLSSEVRIQDKVYVIAGVSPEGREVAWDWLKENWSYIQKNWESTMIGFIAATVPQLTSEEKATEVEAFFANQTSPQIGHTLSQSVERVRNTAQFINHLREEPGFANLIAELSQREC